MIEIIKKHIRRRLVVKLIIAVGLTLLLSIFTWALFNIRTQKQKIMDDIIEGTDRLATTIKLGAHYSMMLNSRDDINQIIQNIAKLEEIENIRIYNKEGKIKFSNRLEEVEQLTNIEAEACYICHNTDPPQTTLELEKRTRIFESGKGYRSIGIIDPIYNERSCSSDACHVHPQDKKVLGALDVVISLKNTDLEIFSIEKGILLLGLLVFFGTSTIIFIFVLKFVNHPIRKLIDRTRLIAKGDLSEKLEIAYDDEIGQLADAINRMAQEIREKQASLDAQRAEYQHLFEQVPCLITVQDQNFKLLRYNREFSERFKPQAGDFCFHAYKDRDEKCDYCPVEETFADGGCHYGEQSGKNRDGSMVHWMLRTSPIHNTEGQIVAAMEISLDITKRKELEEAFRRSEKKYHSIFNNIPNPVFVLDAETLEILDYNDSVTAVYEFDSQEIMNRNFLELFMNSEKVYYEKELKRMDMLNKVRQVTKTEKMIFVNVRISPSEYPGRKVLLVTTSDITKRLETEQQLIQASKMATLGEMASGVAHELNQPLSVIKTSSTFCMKKVRKNEKIDDDILVNLLTKIDKNVDRATKIINHMRQFARKSDMELSRVQLNELMESAFEIFSQQLKLREIEVVWEIEENLPKIKGDPSRLEQVFINLLVNARDAIEKLWKSNPPDGAKKQIVLKTAADDASVYVEVEDNGVGIPESIKDKIFEPFFTTKEVGEGTGLGLSISYGIIKECGGHIRVESEVGKGSCFIIQFPRLKDDHETDHTVS